VVFANGSLQMGSFTAFPDLLLCIVIGVVVPIIPALKERDKSADMDSSLRRQAEVVSSDAVVATRTRRILASSFMFVSVEWVRDESLK
jgi:hypothetical protein